MAHVNDCEPKEEREKREFYSIFLFLILIYASISFFSLIFAGETNYYLIIMTGTNKQQETCDVEKRTCERMLL